MRNLRTKAHPEKLKFFNRDEHKVMIKRYLWLVLLLFLPLVSQAQISSGLSALGQEFARHQRTRPGQPFRPVTPGVNVFNGAQVQVDLTLQMKQLDAATRQLESLGGQRIQRFGNRVSARIPLDRINNLTQLPGLVQAVSQKPITRAAGIAFNQAEPALFADVARGQLNADGSGVTLGVLSDSFDCLGTAEDDMVTGDLPLDVTVLEEFPDCDADTGTDEGRAMLQLIHDIAPGARLLFATGFTGQAAMASNILALADAGATVIVDDIGYAFEPMFQDGIIAQAIDQVAARGVAYFSSAGNDGRLSYQAFFNPQAEPLSGDRAHNFAGTGAADFYQAITVPVDSVFRLVLNWNQPFASAGGQGSASDLDVFILDASQRRVIAAGNDDNLGKDAAEFATFFNDPALNLGTRFHVYIRHRAGPAPDFIKYVFFGAQPSPWPDDLPFGLNTEGLFMAINEYATDSGTLFGHPNALGAMAVGAMPYWETPWFRTSLPRSRIESFSSAGGTPTLFDTQGNRLAQFVIRPKPDVVAVDAVNTTFFPEFDERFDTDGDGLPNFSGTSAAAPNAAAVGALLLQRFPGLPPAQLYQAMRVSALDLNDPATPGANPGFDTGTGFGLLKADAIADALAGGDVQLSIQALPETVGVGDPFAYRVSLLNFSGQTLVNARIRALQLPEVVFDAISGCQAIDSAEVSCALGEVEPGGVRTVTLNVRPALQPASGALRLTLYVLSDTPLPLPTTELATPVRKRLGDFNNDGCVDNIDFGVLLSVFRSGGNDAEFDLNGDGQVNGDDLAVLQTLFTRPDGVACI